MLSISSNKFSGIKYLIPVETFQFTSASKMKIIQIFLLLTLISSSFAFFYDWFDCGKSKKITTTTTTTVRTTTTTRSSDGSGQIDPRGQRLQQQATAPTFAPLGK